MKDLLKKIKYLLVLAYSLFFLIAIFSLGLFILRSNPDLLKLEADKPAKTWQVKSIAYDLPNTKEGELIKYGHQLILNTPSLIGPDAKDASLAYSGNRLTCGNCHLQAGKKIGSGSFVGVTNRFPQFRGRENKIGTMEERINGCMERSMNGKKLPENSREMQAIIAYMKWLSEGVPEDIEKLYKGYSEIIIPERKADTVAGKQLYLAKCKICHEENGTGTLNLDGITYQYPPLSGEFTYNDGAGMNRVITAAEFLKSNMPFGATYDNPILTDEEAYDIAAYINTFERPEKQNKEADFPDKKLKPVSTPYGPWTDPFSPEQHKFGPFQPIMKYYKEKYNITKTK